MKQTKTYLKSRRAGTRARKTVGRHVKLTFIPHKANQYRPHLVRRFGLIVVVFIALSIPAMGNKLSTGSVLGVRDAVTPAGVFNDTNTMRRQHGLSMLNSNSELTAAAVDKAHDMIRHNYWAHTSPQGVTPWHWFDVVGYKYSDAGENLAKNFTTSDAVVSAWMASPEHRANILNQNYADIGIAVVHGQLQGSPVELVVALYGAPASVLGAATSSHPSTLAPEDSSLGIAGRMSVALNSLTPSAIAGVIVLGVATLVALLAHTYRGRLPKTLRVSWYRHHGLYKTLGLVSLVMLLISTYSSGQI